MNLLDPKIEDSPAGSPARLSDGSAAEPVGRDCRAQRWPRDRREGNANKKRSPYNVSSGLAEKKDREQYFFDAPTLEELAGLLVEYPRPCCLCSPLLGQSLVQKGAEATILDLDTRFQHLPGFASFDLEQPQWLNQTFGIIFCDPPFFNVSLKRLLHTIRRLAHFQTDQPLLLCSLERREKALLRAFQEFNVRPSGYYPQYQSVDCTGRNRIQVYGNLSEAAFAKLRKTPGSEPLLDD